MTTAADKTPTRAPGAGDGVLAEPEWLEAHLDDPTVRVVEVDVSRLAHEQGHIDGAVLWDIYAELKDAGYRLADAAAMERLLARSGAASAACSATRPPNDRPASTASPMPRWSRSATRSPAWVYGTPGSNGPEAPNPRQS